MNMKNMVVKIFKEYDWIFYFILNLFRKLLRCEEWKNRYFIFIIKIIN